MPRWRELPASLGEQERRLVVQLRRLKDHSGLSLTSLAARTSYSRSSWERYLNGKKPVPRAAVEELSRVCGVEPTRLLVLHEVVQEVRGAPGSGGPAEAAGAVTEPAPTTGPEAAAPSEPVELPEPAAPSPPPVRPAPRTLRLRTALAGTALAVAAAFVGGLFAGRAWAGDGDGGRSGPRSAAGPGPAAPRCAGGGCAGEDPARPGCGGQGRVTSLATREFGAGRRGEPWYAKACGAVWARAEGLLLPGDRVVVVLPGARAKVVRVAGAEVVRVAGAEVVRVARAKVVRVAGAEVVRVARAEVVRVARAKVVRVAGAKVVRAVRAEEVRAARARGARRYPATRMRALGGVRPMAAEVCLTPADGCAQACFSS
ncbi:helix-turn-helix domain-containing protein [Streptomyces flavofungini]|uniref:helix-turn-helix domain-containing protein n=1 Tax=Streptomyces flavofungini TaxID=68200 RepID=UPI0019C705F1|nr:XRE family transcriptional regulator [Streptomyces flavofungini]GHC69684.1 hypothetical protein GCM10010349_44690 [Streptomyces flavofungini]